MRRRMIALIVLVAAARVDAGAVLELVPGTVFVVHGVDVTQAGFRQIWSGEFTPTETYTIIAEAGHPNVALVVDVGTSLASGVSAAGLAVESVPFRTLPSVTRTPPTRASLIAEFPAVSETGEVNLLNVVRRGVRLTGEELTLIHNTPVVDPAPLATRYFNKRILGDFVKYGRFRGRLGNIETRIATLNELTLLEYRDLRPRTEFFIAPVQTGAGRGIFPDIGVMQPGRQTPVEFVEFIRLRDLSKAPARARAIQNAYPGVPVRFVIVGE